MLYAPNKYRETEGTTDQQNSIDRAKGIIAKPMPEYWYSYRAIDPADPKAELNKKIVAAYKPYFMTYVYPTLRSSYKKYIKETRKTVRRKFSNLGVTTIEELYALPDKTEEISSFLSHYESGKKIGTNRCIVNRICWLFEDIFPKYQSPACKSRFDYSILKCGTEYSQSSYNEIKKVLKEYRMQYEKLHKESRIHYDDTGDYTYEDFLRLFKEKCETICPNELELCDIILDLCYSSETSKRFAWDIVGDTIIENLLNKNGRRISFPVRQGNEFEYSGELFSLQTITLDEEGFL